MATRPDADFAAFRTSGDPAALARVFDAVAPRLLLLAAHWTRDPAEAEDLVQVCFVQAVRDAAQWDEHQPLLRWLGGILAHRAVDRHRGRAGRGGAMQGIDLDGLAAPTRTPLAVAIDRELLDQVTAAVGRLDPPYREVLVLHLVHGLPATAIAHALARAPSTVRKQLERGLQRLRGLLPATLAGAIAALAWPRRGLAAVRAEVLAAAGPPMPSTGLLLGGSMLVSKLAVALLVLVLVAITWMSPSTPPSPVESAGATARREEAAIAEVATAAGAGLAAPAAVRRPAAMGAGATLEVAVVRAADGVALPGIEVCLLPDNGRDEELERRTARTDAAGRTRFDGVPAGPVAITATAFDHLSIGVDLRAGACSEAVLRLPVGHLVTGTVVDSDARPLEGATVSLRAGLGLPNRNPPGPCATSAADGTFALAVPSAVCAVQATTPDLAASPIALVDGGAPPRALVLRVGGAAARLGGKVVGDGKPVPEALVELAPTEVDQHRDGEVMWYGGGSTFAHSDANGEFALVGLRPGVAQLRVRAHGRMPQELEVTLVGGAAVTVAIDLPRGPTLRGRVHEPGGDPVAGASIECGQARTRSGADGTFALDCLPSGPARVLVAGRADHAAAERQVDLVAGVVTAIDVELEALPSLRGRVVDVAGRGLASLRVVACRLDQGLQTIAPVADELGRLDLDNIRTADTDQSGGFALPVMPGVAYQLAVQQPAQWFLAVPPTSLAFTAPRNDVVLTVPPSGLASAYVTGRVIGTAGAPIAGAWLQLADGERIGTIGVNTPGTQRTDGSGRFRIGPVPARRYSLRVHPLGAAQPEFEAEPFTLAVAGTQDLGDVVAPATAMLQVALRGRAGDTFRGAMLQCVAAGQERYYEFDADGRLEQALVPGGYDLVVYGERFPSRRRHVDLAAGQVSQIEVDVSAGRQHRLVVELPAGEDRGALQIRGADGEIEFEADCERADPDGGTWSPVLTDGPHSASLDCGERRYAGHLTVDGDGSRSLRLSWSRLR